MIKLEACMRVLTSGKWTIVVSAPEDDPEGIGEFITALGGQNLTARTVGATIAIEVERRPHDNR